MTGRLALGAVGVVAGVYAAWLLLAQGWDNLVSTVVWLAGGVIANDALIALVALLVGVAVVALVPVRIRGPVVAGLLVLATVTLSALPSLGRFGARPDNATLLDRNYGVGWLVFAVLVLLGTAAGVVRARRTPSSGAGDDVVREPHDEQEA